MEEKLPSEQLKVDRTYNNVELASNSIHVNTELYTQLFEANDQKEPVYVRPNNTILVAKPSKDIFQGTCRMSLPLRNLLKIKDPLISQSITVELYKLDHATATSKQLSTVEFLVTPNKPPTEASQVDFRLDRSETYVKDQFNGHFLKQGHQLFYETSVESLYLEFRLHPGGCQNSLQQRRR